MLRSGGGLPGPQGPAGASGSPGTPGQSYGATLLSGGSIRYVSNLQFVVSQATYTINGVSYTSAETTVTLSAADGSNPRIDVIVLNTSSVAAKVDGTAAATPAEASIDPLTQLRLTAVYVAAGATSISVTTTNVYLENTEWTSSVSGAGMNAASTSNPRTSSKCIEATAATNGQYVNLSNGSAFDTTTRNFLSFYIRNKASWPSAKSVVIQWYNGSTAVGTAVTLKNGAYGFNHSNVSGYQLIGIPISAFGVAGLTVTAVRFTVTGGSSAIGFYIDDIVLQGGVIVITPTDAMRWMGDYSAAVQYQLNDVVMYSGRMYIARQALLAVTPTGAGWTALGFNPAAPGAIGGTTPAAGTFTAIADAIGDVRTIPQNSKSAAYTTVLSDAGKHLLHPAADANARTFTIDSNANVAYPVGTAITFVNQTSQVLSIAITSDTMTLANSTTTGTRSLAQNGVATALKVSSTGWIISGSGLT